MTTLTIRWAPATLAFTAVMLALGAAPVRAASGGAEVTGTVRAADTLDPIAGAIVSLQATGLRAVTGPDGAYTLSIPAGTDLVIVAAAKGFFNGSVRVDGPPPVLDFAIDPVPQDDDPTYQIESPVGCGVCHPDQFSQWLGSPMSKAGTNTWVHDIYNGTGTAGGMGGFVYTRDSRFAGSNPNSECASCHQPESWLNDLFSRMEGPQDAGYPSESTVHGISCEMCHKIAHVNVKQINYPGIFPGAVDFTRPAAPDYLQVQYGLLGDTDYFRPDAMRPSYQPQLVAEVCGVCHQDKNDIHENGTFDGVISEPTYLEWLASPFGDIKSPYYADCLDCHMPSSGQTTACVVQFPEVERDPETLRDHHILGTTPEFLENAAELFVETAIVDDELRVHVDVFNAYTGHHLPTGVTVRNMILLVEATRDADGTALEFVGDQVVHDLGGVGDPDQGYYAGLPGKFFAKVNHDENGNGPTFFTDATGIQFDSRIPGLEIDTTHYAFSLPEAGGAVRLRVRLIYRRAFRFIVDAKQWTEDGHGQPLGDMQPPHYGHLMEMEELLVTCGPVDLDGDFRVGFSDLLQVLRAWGPCEACPEDLDGDGVVGFNDLLTVLTSWGPCA